MKTLKELNQKCNLIAEFVNPAWVSKYSNELMIYKKPAKCAIYSDNKGKYYIYKYITKEQIEKRNTYESAAESFKTFVEVNMER